MISQESAETPGDKTEGGTEEAGMQSWQFQYSRCT